MTYTTIEKRKYARARKHKLAELWTNCKSRDEFFIQADLKYPDATFREIAAFKIHYFNKMHPIMRIVCWMSLLFIIVPAIIFFITNGNIIDTVFSSLVAWPIIGLIYLYIFGDYIQTIEWYENGCPIQY